VLQRNISSSFNKWTYFDNVGGYDANATPLSNFASFNLERSYSEGTGMITPIYYQFDKKEFTINGTSRTQIIGVDSTMILQSKSYGTGLLFCNRLKLKFNH
jgi:hypothetical protein